MRPLSTRHGSRWGGISMELVAGVVAVMLQSRYSTSWSTTDSTRDGDRASARSGSLFAQRLNPGQRLARLIAQDQLIGSLVSAAWVGPSCPRKRAWSEAASWGASCTI